MVREQLQRVMRTPEVLFIGINGVVGGGIFLLPGQVAGAAGGAAVWAYLAAGLLVILIGLSYAEISAMYDRTGGPLVYVGEAMGKTAGFSVGWMVWVTYLVGWAVLSNGFVGYLGSLWSPAETYKIPIIIGLVALLCLLNTLGVRLGTRVIQFFTVAKLIPLALLVVAGFTFAGVSGNAFLGEVPPGGDFFAAVLIVIFAYGGFEGATIPAGEMRNPRRTISVAVLGTLVSVTVFYMLIQYAALRIEPDLAGSDTPLAAAGGAMFAGGLVLMTIGAMISIFGTKSGVALTSPRDLYALSNEGMLPAFLSRVSPRFRTPTVAIWTTGALVVILAVTGTFTQLLLLNVAARLYQYLMVCVSVVIQRRRDPLAERPFRLPLGVTIPSVAAILCAALFTQQPIVNILVAIGALAVGLVLYALGRDRTARTP
ncbi:MAG: APC family permease [Actinomycetota bacterium]|nr:APC family permease [Actinomycetota bacterium]